MNTITLGEDITPYYSDPMQDKLTIMHTEGDDYANDTACGEKLIKLHEDLQRLDFPYYFVEILTTNGDIERELVTLQKLYSTEETHINYLVINGRFKKNVYKGDTKCILPFIHKYINPQGLVMPCCIGNENFPIGNLNHDNLQDISTLKIRNTMIKGQRPDACSTCWQKEDMGLESLRINVNRHWEKYKDQKDFTLRHLDIRLSNICNLKCRMCSGKFSNRIAQEELEIYGFTKYKNEILEEKLKQKVLQYIEDNIDTIESVNFAGGEPLINKEHYDILDILIKHNKTNVRLRYSTNFSILKFKTYDILSYWKKFKKVNLGASIDSIGKQSNYVRNGVEYNVFEKNYNKVKNLKNIDFQIYSTLHLCNILNLPDLQKRWVTLGLPCSKLNFDLLVNPEEQSITVLPIKFKKQAEEKILSHIKFLENVSDSTSIIDEWKNVIKFMNGKDNSKFLKKFFQLTDDKDKFRNQKFEDYFPEYKDLRNYA